MSQVADVFRRPSVLIETPVSCVRRATKCKQLRATIKLSTDIKITAQTIPKRNK